MAIECLSPSLSASQRPGRKMTVHGSTKIQPTAVDCKIEFWSRACWIYAFIPLCVCCSARFCRRIDVVNDYTLRKSGIRLELPRAKGLAERWATIAFIASIWLIRQPSRDCFPTGHFDGYSFAAQAGVRYSLENPTLMSKATSHLHHILEHADMPEVDHLTYASRAALWCEYQHHSASIAASTSVAVLCGNQARQ